MFYHNFRSTWHIDVFNTVNQFAANMVDTRFRTTVPDVLVLEDSEENVVKESKKLRAAAKFWFERFPEKIIHSDYKKL